MRFTSIFLSSSALPIALLILMLLLVLILIFIACKFRPWTRFLSASTAAARRRAPASIRVCLGIDLMCVFGFDLSARLYFIFLIRFFHGDWLLVVLLRDWISILVFKDLRYFADRIVLFHYDASFSCAIVWICIGVENFLAYFTLLLLSFPHFLMNVSVENGSSNQLWF